MKLTPATQVGQRWYYVWLPQSLANGDTAYIFMGIDECSQFIIDLQVEDHITDEMVSEKVKALVEHPDFKATEKFELIIEGSPYAHQKINEIIQPIGGTLIQDEQVHDEFVLPILKKVFGS